MFPRSALIAAGALLATSAHAQTLSNTGLIAYYTFESTGNAGIANTVGGGATHNGAYLATSTIAGTGAGYAGSTAYAGAETANTTNRSDLLIGKALNIAKSDASTTAGRGAFVVSSLTSLPSTTGGTMGTSYTISAWFNLIPDADNTGTDGNVLRDSVWESRYAGTSGTADSFDSSFGTSDTNGTSFTSYVGPTAAGTLLAANTWNHVVHSVTASGGTSTLRVYINGSLRHTLTANTVDVEWRELIIGADRVGRRLFDGMIDEVSVWNRALTADEASLAYLLGSNGYGLGATLPVLTKAANATSLSAAGAWTQATAPDSGTTLAFDGTFAGGDVDTGAALAVLGLRVGAGTDAIRITGTGGALTVGGFGIDLAAAERDLTVENLALGGDQTWNVASGRTLTIGAASSLSGAYSLTKSGPGTVVLGGANTYTGTTTVSGGTLAIAASSALPGLGTNGRVSVASGAALSLGNGVTDAEIAAVVASTHLASGAILALNTSAGDRTLSDILGNTPQGNLILRKEGANTLTLSGANTFAGGLTVAAGTVRLGADGVLADAGAVTVAAGATLDLNGRAETIGLLTLNGSLAGSGTLASSLAANTNGFIATVGTGVTTTFSAALAGEVNLRKEGAGTLVLSGANTYGSGTLIAGGWLEVSDIADTGSSNLGILGGAGTAPRISLVGGNLRYTGSGSQSTTRALWIDSVAATVDVTQASATLTLAPSAGTRNQAFTKSGAGTLVLNGIVSGAATLSVTGGKLALGAANTQTGAITVASGATLEVTSGGRLAAAAHSAAIALDGTLLLNGASAQALSGSITGAGSITKGGTGTLTLGGSNSFASLSSSAGTLLAGSDTALGSGTVTLTGGRLAAQGANARTLANALVIGADISLGDATNTGALTLTGTAALGSGTRTLTVDSQVTFAGAVTGDSLTKAGAGTLILNAANTLTGTVDIQAGTLVIGNAGALGSAAITLSAGSTLDLAGLAAANTLTLAGGSLLNGEAWAGSATLTGTVSAATLQSLGGTGQITIGTGTSADLAGVNRAIQLTGGTVTGLNGFLGTLTLANGADLDLDGPGNVEAQSAADFVVGLGSILSGTGRVGQATVAGNLAPGNSPGALEFTDGLALESTSVLDWEFDAAVFDVVGAIGGDNTDLILVSGGSLTLATGATLNLINLGDVDYTSFFWDSAQRLVVAEIGQAASYDPDEGFTLNLIQAGNYATRGNWSLAHSPTLIEAVWTPVPEPSTYGLALGLLALGATAWRRRRRS